MAVLTLRIFRLSVHHILFVCSFDIWYACAAVLFFTRGYICICSFQAAVCCLQRFDLATSQRLLHVSEKATLTWVSKCSKLRCGHDNSITVSIARVFVGDVELVSFQTEM